MNIGTHALSAIALALFAVASCASTRSAGGQIHSGFLSDYDRLEQPDSDRAAFWANPDFDLGNYNAFRIPEIEFWIADGAGAEDEDAQKLAALFREKLSDKMIANGWSEATASGPGVIDLRIALTELKGASRFGNALTSLPYLSTQVIQLTSAATDVHVFVGQASTELQISDSSTGVILAEAIDRRVGAHSLGNFASTWGDVKDALGVFAQRISEGLSKTDN